MKTTARFIICSVLIMLLLALTGCGGTLSAGEKEALLQQAIEERQIDQIDEELTATLMAENKVKYAYVAENNGAIEVYIAFVAGTKSAYVNDLSKKANEMAKEKYPDHTISVSGSID
jgi:hypothetical protein